MEGKLLFPREVKSGKIQAYKLLIMDEIVNILTLPLFLVASSLGKGPEQAEINETLTTCVSLATAVAAAFPQNTVSLSEGILVGTDKVSLHYQNRDKSFKGICSNGQFTLENSVLSGTSNSQFYLFIWSNEQNLLAPELSLDNIQFQTEMPMDIELWLNSGGSDS